MPGTRARPGGTAGRTVMRWRWRWPVAGSAVAAGALLAGPARAAPADGQQALWAALVVTVALAALALTVVLIARLSTNRRRLLESEARFRDFAEVAADWFWEVDADGVYTYISERHHELTGYAPTRLLGRCRWTVLAEAGVDTAALDEQKRQFEHREPFVAERPYITPDGTPAVLRTEGRPFHDADGRFAGYRGIGRDVTGERRVEDRLREAAAVFDAAAEAVMILDRDRRILRVNNAFAEITGYSEPEVVGQPLSILRPDDEDRAAHDGIWDTVAKRGQVRGEARDRRRDGSVLPVWQCINEVRDDSGEVTHYVRVALDISTLKEYQARMEHLAHHDPLTGLANRVLLEQRLEQSLQRARRNGALVAVLFLDLDGFKRVNDARGHDVGDELLRQAAARLDNRLRASDTVARVAGDEFLVVLDDVAGPEAAARVAAELADRLAEPVHVRNDELLVTASIGVAMYPDDGEDVTTLTKNADAAMYRAKQQGRNRYCLYTEEITVGVQRRLNVERRLRRALEGDELEVHYQPQFECRDLRLVGAEALARWTDAELGRVAPDEFVRAAEDAGMVEHLDQWVMHTAAAQVIQWDRAGLHLETVAVNVSGRGIERGTLPTSVGGVLALVGLEAGRLELEVIETQLVKGTDMTRILDTVRATGARLAVDDFGTGYSSLEYLKALPADRLKIDRCFVDRIDRDSADRAIVAAIVTMARSLGMTVVAEGIETASQLEIVREVGCDLAQGYFLGHPVPAGEFLEAHGASGQRVSS